MLFSQNGAQPIHYAAMHGYLEVIHLLVKKYHVDPNTLRDVSPIAMVDLEGFMGSMEPLFVVIKYQGIGQDHMHISLLQNWAVAPNANVWTYSPHDSIVSRINIP